MTGNKETAKPVSRNTLVIHGPTKARNSYSFLDYGLRRNDGVEDDYEAIHNIHSEEGSVREVSYVA